MMAGVDNQALRDRYHIHGLFEADSVSLNYTHNERMVIGGAAPVSAAVSLPDQKEPVAGDADCGGILEHRETPAERGAKIFELILETASGRRSASEMSGFGDLEFVPWQVGAVL